jgi:hypothetical protein
LIGLPCFGLAAAPGPAQAQTPATSGNEMSLSVLQGHVLLVPVDPQTGQMVVERRIEVSTGHKALLSRGGAPLVTLMSRAELAHLAAVIGRLQTLAPKALPVHPDLVPPAAKKHDKHDKHSDHH